jgi:hypothetical protein
MFVQARYNNNNNDNANEDDGAFDEDKYHSEVDMGEMEMTAAAGGMQSSATNRPRSSSRSIFEMISPSKQPRGSRGKAGVPQEDPLPAAFEHALRGLDDDAQWDTFGIPDMTLQQPPARAVTTIDGRAMSPIDGRTSSADVSRRRSTPTTNMAAVHAVIPVTNPAPFTKPRQQGNGSNDDDDDDDAVRTSAHLRQHDEDAGEWQDDNVEPVLTIRRFESTSHGQSEGGVAFKVHSGYTLESNV